MDNNKMIKHNGRAPALLYTIDEPIVKGVDIRPHPASSMSEGLEWITIKPLRLRLMKEIGQPRIQEVFTQQEIDQLRKMERLNIRGY